MTDEPIFEPENRTDCENGYYRFMNELDDIDTGEERELNVDEDGCLVCIDCKEGIGYYEDTYGGRCIKCLVKDVFKDMGIIINQ